MGALLFGGASAVDVGVFMRAEELSLSTRSASCLRSVVYMSGKQRVVILQIFVSRTGQVQ